jgi:uncharacterized protein (TIGR04255 family)
MNAPQIPLVGPPPSEIPLATPPLVRVIAQVRFPMILSVEKKEFIAAFQEAIRNDYPILRREQNVLLDLEGMEKRPSTTWNFHDPKTKWRVALTADFLALETTDYSSREDFLARLRRVLQPLAAHFNPAAVDRLGVRYVDRIEGENLADLPLLIRPEVCGILASPLRDHVPLSITESLFELLPDEGRVKARWGLLPSQRTVEPAVVEEREAPSWILDLDAFRVFPDGQEPFDVDAIVDRARGFAERIYSIFRWSITDEFLRRYGGET